MLHIHYFASVREALQKDSEQLALPGDVTTITDLIAYLSANDNKFKTLNESGNPLLVAINQTVVDASYKIGEDDEVAFFPPMTGG